MYCIFYKYYKDLEKKEEEVIKYFPFSDYNILSLVSGVQIIKFRKNYINLYGEEKFLEKYKDFDVIYKEYILAGTIIFIVVFLINFCFILYLKRTYKLYRIDNPEINNYTLILSGKDVPFINNEKIEKDQNNRIKDRKIAIKNELLKELDVKEADINFTLKLSEYYKKMEELLYLQKEEYRVQSKSKRDKCCLYRYFYSCSKCFCCCKEENIEDKIENLKKEMNAIKEKEIYNPLYIITFKNKEDYNNVYSKYPHSYIINTIKNLCKKKNERSFYITKHHILKKLSGKI